MLYRLKIMLLLVVITVVSCKNDENQEVKPFIQDIREWVFAPGQIEWDDVYNLTAQTDGILLDANYDIGTLAKEGSIIARVYNNSSLINSST